MIAFGVDVETASSYTLERYQVFDFYRSLDDGREALCEVRLPLSDGGAVGNRFYTAVNWGFQGYSRYETTLSRALNLRDTDLCWSCYSMQQILDVLSRLTVHV